jgi:SpoVK/Ycf46/Vps4 family AAA+-type ATPase
MDQQPSVPTNEASSLGPDTQLDDPTNGWMGSFDIRHAVWTQLSRSEARKLPATLSAGLVIAYCALTRGDDLQYGSQEAFDRSSEEAVRQLKTFEESRYRQLGLTSEQVELHLLPNIVHLLLSHPQMRFAIAVRTYLESINRGRLDLVEENQLRASVRTFREELKDWLQMNKIPYTTKPPVIFAKTRLVRILQKFKGLPDVFLAPEIPPNKLQSAASVLGFDSVDEVYALIDCTFWGSAKDCVSFGSSAIAFHNNGRSGFLPYSDFLDRTFTSAGASKISLGRNLELDLNGSSLPQANFLQILEEIKKECFSDPSEEGKGSGPSELAGMQEMKEILLEEVIAPLREPEKYRRYGISIPNGILMYGPPGCGKTFVARWLAAELGLKYFEVSPSEIASSYQHGSTLKIRDLFVSASAAAPALMFVDEFEGLVPARSALSGEQQHKAEEVNEWLVQIGSCAEREILFVAATNEPWKIDSAILRTGRLDKKIHVGPPDKEAITEMLGVHLRGRHIAGNMNIGLFASQIAGRGYSASDLKVLVDEAAKLAMRNNTEISDHHLAKAASEKVPPSISVEIEESYRAFAGRALKA